MAKVLYGAFIVELKGKVGGSCFQANRYGFTLRNKPMSPKGGSMAQSGQRSKMVEVSQVWGQLTDAERTAWNSISGSWPHLDSFGNPVQLTGFNLFVMVSLNLMSIGQAINSVASVPAVLFAFSITSMSSSFAGSVLRINFSPTPVVDDCDMIVWASPPVNPGAGLIVSKLKVIQIVALASVSPLSIGADYAKTFGLFPPEGTRVGG